MSKSKVDTKISPKGVFVYPYLTKPDTEYKTSGEYHLKLRVSAEDAAPMIELIDNAIKDNLKAVEKDKGKKVKRVDPPYVVEEDGTVLFTFKMTATGKRKDTGEDWSQKPGLKSNRKGPDGKLEDLPDDVQIWGGTEGKVAYSLFPYFVAGTGAGVKLRLKVVQVVKLVTGGGQDYGFDEEPGESNDEDASDSGEEFTEEEDGESAEGAGDADF